MPRYNPYEAPIEKVWQGDEFVRGFHVSTNFDLTGKHFKCQVRKTYGNKAILLEFKEEDNTLVVDPDERVIWLMKPAADMQIETGLHVYDIKETTENQRMRIGTFEVRDTATRDNA